MIMDLRQYNIGVTFGYPLCCCEHFSSNEDPAGGLPDDNIFIGTGYIPCPSCRELDPILLLKYIDTHRLFPGMFPEDHLLGNKMISRKELLGRFNDEG
jgi:hypothetical protein